MSGSNSRAVVRKAGAQRAAGLVLALDTCGAEATLALGKLSEDADGSDAAVEILRSSTLAARTTGSALTAALRGLLGPVLPAELRAIVAVRGPGSFTGMRIGLSAAKALSEAVQAPIVGVSRLAVFAALHRACYVALDAGRGNVYLRVSSQEEEAMLTADEAREQLRSVRLEEVMLCEDKVQSLFPVARRVAMPTAEDALTFAVPRVLAEDWDDTATLDALYLWRAEQMLGKPVATP